MHKIKIINVDKTNILKYGIYCVTNTKHDGYKLKLNCIEDSKTEDKTGVAMVTSAGPWLAGKDLLLKNRFEIVDYYPPHYELLVKKNKEGSIPKFKRDRERILKEYTGLNIIFANQCPYVVKSVKELALIAKSRGLPLKIIELESPIKAQNAPTPYGVFSVVYNGRLLADHYISNTRFKNILDKEI